LHWERVQWIHEILKQMCRRNWCKCSQEWLDNITKRTNFSLVFRIRKIHCQLTNEGYNYKKYMISRIWYVKTRKEFQYVGANTPWIQLIRKPPHHHWSDQEGDDHLRKHGKKGQDPMMLFSIFGFKFVKIKK